MSESVNNDDALASVRNDLAALRNDVGALIASLERGARNSASSAADQITGGVRGLTESAAEGGQQSVKAIGAWIEEKPLLAFLIAVGVGFLGARALLR